MAFLGRPSERDDARAAAYRDWLRERHPFAVASFVLGLVSLIEFGVLIVFGVAGIVLGVIALVQLRQISAADSRPPMADGGGEPPGTIGPSDPLTLDPIPKTRGRRLAVAGIALSAVSLVLAAVLYNLPRAS